MTTYKSVKWNNIKEGDNLPPIKREITRTTVISTAIATRDFQDVHHDHEAAKRSGTPDIFLNILTTGGLIGKFLTGWSGPESELKNVVINLALPCYPGDTLTSTGQIVKKYTEGDDHLVEIAYSLTTGNGAHGSGTATMALPK